jgi:uncharacterized membrane protein
MAAEPSLIEAIKQLNYRVTVSDVAVQSGLELQEAEHGLLALAQESGGHLQVAPTGNLVYVFPADLEGILYRKSFKRRLRAVWLSLWPLLFYLVRIFFGILLITSILLMLVAIALILTAWSSQQDDRDRSDSSIDWGGFDLGTWGSDAIWVFNPEAAPRKVEQMGFLESVFSFLFGDGNPNAQFDECRWQTIGKVIRQNQGVVTAEQMAPYLDQLGSEDEQATEDFMIPVLVRFNGSPEVSPVGEIVYCFPELQVGAAQTMPEHLPSYLEKHYWKFSQASEGQRFGAIALGVLNFILAIILGGFLLQGAASLGGFVGLVAALYPLLLFYGISFLTIPLGRWLWLRRHNRLNQQLNQERKARASRLKQLPSALREKLNFAHSLGRQKQVIRPDEAIYSTERDLLEQEIEHADQLDQAWQERLQQQ